MRKVGLIVRDEYTRSGTFSLNLVKKLAEKGIAAWWEQDTTKDVDNTDLILVLGGDGTILRAFRDYGHLQIPFVGINCGTVGFLSSFDPDELDEYWCRIVESDYLLDERSILRLLIRKKNQPFVSSYALNDVVIRTTNLHVSRQVVTMGDKEIFACEGDGIVIATSTGSTGYTFSAGGAVVEPSMECMVVTPICARNMTLKTMVFSLEHDLTVTSRDRSACTVFVDGFKLIDINESDSVTIGRADIKAKFVSLNPERYFNLLHHKAENRKI